MNDVQVCRTVKSAQVGDLSAVERATIATESAFILAHPSFKNSKRCVSLLQHLIEQALSGNLDGIKERTLGVEVFGRDPDYDTNSDPIVRMAANEIRKRLAQFYQESDRRRVVKIGLAVGAYVPQFEFETSEKPPGVREPELTQGMLRPVPFPIPKSLNVEVVPATSKDLSGSMRGKLGGLSALEEAALRAFSYVPASEMRSWNFP